MKKGEIEISFESRIRYIDLIQDVSDRVTEMAGFDEDSRYWIGMSVRESVTNAIQHGNKFDENKTVAVRFEILGDGVIIFVTDQGEGFEESDVPDPLAQENLLRPSGRGIFYLKSFMDDVSFRRLPGGGLEVRMEKRINQHANDSETP